MNSYFENKLSMYQKVQGFLTLHAAELALIPMVATQKTTLDAEILILQGHYNNFNADITGHTVDKNNQRQILKASLLKVSTAVVAHASINNINKLLEKCDETSSKLDQFRDNDFYTYSQTVLAEATPIIALLAPYNVLPADLTSLNAKSASFLAIIQDPRLQINERQTSRINLENSFDTIDELLQYKLDKVMGVFQSQNISLFNGYMGARSIDDDGTGSSTPDFEGAIAPNELLAVASIAYLSGRTFKFKNLGDVPLNFGLSTDPNSLNGTPVEVAPGSESQRNSDNLNPDNNAIHLIIENTNPQPSEYKIWIIE